MNDENWIAHSKYLGRLSMWEHVGWSRKTCGLRAVLLNMRCRRIGISLEVPLVAKIFFSWDSDFNFQLNCNLKRKGGRGGCERWTISKSELCSRNPPIRRVRTHLSQKDKWCIVFLDLKKWFLTLRLPSFHMRVMRVILILTASGAMTKAMAHDVA